VALECVGFSVEVMSRLRAVDRHGTAAEANSPEYTSLPTSTYLLEAGSSIAPMTAARAAASLRYVDGTAERSF
jgi:hypothetical protein